MRLNVLTADGEGFAPPSTADFWHPLLGTDGMWAFTRPMILATFAALVLCAVGVLAARKLSVVPGKGQFLAELLYEIPRNAIGRDMIGAKDFKPFIPLLVSLFMFIFLNNLFGVIPFISYPTASRIGFPIALTAIVYLVYLGIGFAKHGAIGYFKRMIPAGVPAFVVPVLLVLEIITYFITRPVTLAMRLFANMFAGHMLLLVFILGGEYMLLHGSNIFINIGGVFGFFMGIVMTFFELLIQFLQAYVFTLLAAFYIADALAEEH